MFLIALVLSVAAVDALNPSTVLPALYFALGRHAVRDIAGFTAGVFGVSTVGGLVLVFGPGRALLGVVSHPSKHAVHIVEGAVGVVLLVAAVFLWLTRARLARRLTNERGRTGSSAFLLGAGIMATELPTALPYFGALVAVTEGTHGVLAPLALVIAYNLVFVSLLVALLVVVALAGERGARFAEQARRRLIRYTPTVVAVLVGALGLTLIVAALL